MNCKGKPACGFIKLTSNAKLERGIRSHEETMSFPEPSTHDGAPTIDLSGCIDLHMHSKCSDGHYEPEQLVEWASELGLSAIALTDHDTTKGVARAIRRGEELGVEVIPGCEISVTYSGGTFHLLGYFVDYESEAFNKTMAGIMASRTERNRKIVAALNAHGMEITHEELLEEAGEATVGRPHMAQIMIRKGYVSDFREAFDKYLAEGMPCYFPSENFGPERAIKLVLEAGGVPVIAHPFWLNRKSLKDLDAYIGELVGYGLKGMEIVYPDHSPEIQRAYFEIAKKHDLIVTGGSDFHGGGVVKPEVTLGHGTGGDFCVPAELLEGLKAARVG